MKPIIALDFVDFTQTSQFLQLMPSQEPLYIKIGMELFYHEGAHIIDKLKNKGHRIFLDLKLHDIPNTVKSAMIQLAKMGVDMVNVHAAGGSRMMESALEGLIIGSGASPRPLLLGVTQLTSMTEQEMQESQATTLSLLESVLHLSRLSHSSGLDGVVCSAQEAKAVKEATHQQFLCVTPGIRLASDHADDQRRVMTPYAARQNQADAIVVGRSITQAKDPKHAYLKIKQEWEREK